MGNVVPIHKDMLISDEYRQLNKSLHESRKDYGSHGHRLAEFVSGLAANVGTEDILDYGAGKCTLANALPQLSVKNYDPAIPGIDELPEPSDMVVCGDVLEHIEPDCLDAVLDDLVRVTKKVVILAVATRPAKKTLPDGRNAHLIQQPYSWWLPKIWDRFVIDLFQNQHGQEFIIVGRPKGKHDDHAKDRPDHQNTQ